MRCERKRPIVRPLSRAFRIATASPRPCKYATLLPPPENIIVPTATTGAVRKIALLGNYLPRRCGIATFTTDLTGAIAAEYPELDCFALAMNDPGKSHTYPSRVRFEISEGDLSAYRRAADFLNVDNVDLLCVQHEFGIFGGKAGSHLLALLREVRMPIVTTLHTILREPNAQQRTIVDDLARVSDRLVAMSSRGAKLLREVYHVPEQKIDVIPHGIPFVGSTDRPKSRLGVEGKWVILTFGLLSPDKGVEYVIEALPAIVERHPNAVYLLVGATHPHVKDRHGEAYRLSLENRAQILGVAPNVIFHNRFVSQAELIDFLSITDIYITPYVNPEQITSGTLAYAVGAGAAVISTPYSYAEELLAEGRGVLVPWKDPAAIARQVNDLLEDDERRLALQRRASAHGRAMLWPAVARSYRQSFERARAEHTDRRQISIAARALETPVAELPEVKLDHVRTMTDQTGMLQHAAFDVPRYDDGYCLDDNARALLLMALLEDAGVDDRTTVRALASRYLAFVNHAFNPSLGRFRNFMSYSRRWLDECGSEDSHGRAVWALGTVIGRSEDPGKQNLGNLLFRAALPAVPAFTSPRAWAFVLLGIDEYLRAFRGESEVERLRKTLSGQLLDLFRLASRPDWPWFERTATYCNARLSHALLVSGSRMQNEEMIGVGCRSLEWLLTVQSRPNGCFAPIGSNGFFERGRPKAAFDQQPIEAATTVSACIEAMRVTENARWFERGRRVFDWFLGDNELQQSLYDAATGGCRDGLHPDRVNENQGAESTLSFQLALLDMHSVGRLGTMADLKKAGS